MGQFNPGTRDASRRGTALGLRLLGADGLVRPGTWQHQWLFAPAWHLAGGTDEVHHNNLGEQALGLPRDIRVDKDVPWRTIPKG